MLLYFHQLAFQKKNCAAGRGALVAFAGSSYPERCLHQLCIDFVYLLAGASAAVAELFTIVMINTAQKRVFMHPPCYQSEQRFRV